MSVVVVEEDGSGDDDEKADSGNPRPRDHVSLTDDGEQTCSKDRVYTDGVNPEYILPCTTCPGPVECFCVDTSRVWCDMKQEVTDDESHENKDDRKRRRDEDDSNETEEEDDRSWPVVDGRVQPPTQPPDNRPGNKTNQLLFL